MTELEEANERLSKRAKTAEEEVKQVRAELLSLKAPATS